MFYSATFYLSFHVFSSKSVIHLTYVLELWKLHRSVINNCSHFFCVHVQPVVIDECCYSCPDTALQAAQTRLALCCWAQWWIVGQLYQRLSSDVHYWLVVWHICNTFVIFPYFHSVGNVIIPTDELIFFRGVGIPPTRLQFDTLRENVWHHFPSIWGTWDPVCIILSVGSSSTCSVAAGDPFTGNKQCRAHVQSTRIAEKLT